MTDQPLWFSVIIPAYNRPQALTRLLEGLSKLEAPKDFFEVIVVDDGSEKSLDPVPLFFREKFFLCVLQQVHGGPAAARNRGAQEAKGKFLVFTDDDCVPSAGWLKRLNEKFTEFPGHAIIGKVTNALPENIYSSASQMLIDFLHDYYNEDPTRARFITSNNLALPKARFEELGGFDPLFTRAAGEDREFCCRWLEKGYGILYAEEAVVEHAHPLSFLTFWGQHFHYGRAAFWYHKKRAGRGQGRIRIEPFSFYFRLIGYPLTHARGLRKWMLFTLMVFSQTANAIGFFSEGFSQWTKR